MIVLGSVLALTVVLGPVAAGGGECCKTTPAAAADQWEQQWGIQLAGLRLSGQGYFVDFRYKVLDPEKAAPLADKDKRPYLIHEESGKKLYVPTTPKLGALRQTAQKLKPGQIYFMFFSNRSGTLKSGSKVTMVIGDVRLENLVIQ